MKAGTMAAVAAGMATMCGVGVAQADTITEYFNNYGTADSSLDGKNGPSDGTRSWNGAWTAPQNNFNSNGALSSNNLSYTATGYNNSGNQNDLEDGAAGGTANSTTGSMSTFARREILGNELAGTIWISALARPGGNGTARFLLDPSTSTSPTNFVQLNSMGTASVRYGTSTSVTPVNIPTTAPANAANLFLMRLTIDSGMATNDGLDFWVNPDLSSGESGLIDANGNARNAQFSMANANAFGIGFQSIGLGFSGGPGDATTLGSRIDSIRISNDPNAFSFVTQPAPVPEPGTIVMMLMGLTGMGGAARRKRRQKRSEAASLAV